MSFPRNVWTYWAGTPSRGVEQCVRSWKHHLGESWKITIVDDEKLFSLVPRGYLPSNYESLDVKKRSDSARVALVRKHGGVWADTHILLLENYDWVLDLFDNQGMSFVGYLNPDHSAHRDTGVDYIESWWFAALPESPIIKGWNEAWVRGVEQAASSSPGDFTETDMFRVTHFPNMEEQTKNYLFIGVTLAHARRHNPSTKEEFDAGRAHLLDCYDGPSWHWNEENHNLDKLKQQSGAHFFKFVAIQHKHCDEAAGNRTRMESPFYKELFEVNAPQTLTEKVSVHLESEHYRYLAFLITVLIGLVVIVAIKTRETKT